MMIKKEIIDLAKSIAEEAVKHRHFLHQNPELSFKEEKTSEYIDKTLKSYGLNPERIAENGLVALIEGKEGGKTIALRADIDALPIIEENIVVYKSVNHGVMHACGHDFHTATLLGVSKLLNELKDKFSGTIKIIFQPAEERIPGGAKKMIEEGVLKNPDVDFIIGQHVYPDLETGNFGFRGGMYMASTDEIYINIKGKGGHAAMPWKITDTVNITNQLLLTLQQMISRKAPANVPTVLSFGKVIANGATNIIPDVVNVEGTFRTFDEEWRKQAHNNILEISEKLVSSFGAKVDVEIRKGYPSLINDEEKTKQCFEEAKDFLGAQHVHELDMRMTAEDFAYFSREIPAVFYRIGTANHAKGISSPLHSPTFNVDDDAMETSIGLMSYLTISELKR
jgi:amidohydrolase